MKVKFLKGDFSVCQLRDLSKLNMASDLFFLGKTSDELSLVCLTDEVPPNVLKVDHGWRMFKVEGQLDFSLVGILSNLARVLADRGISIFAVSTFDTDYILIKVVKADEAREALTEAGYELV